MPNKPISNYSGASASAVDADNHAKGQDAADAELSRIESWTQPNFAGGGRQQLQRDESFGYREKRTGK
jgi:hypothetical protein